MESSLPLLLNVAAPPPPLLPWGEGRARQKIRETGSSGVTAFGRVLDVMFRSGSHQSTVVGSLSMPSPVRIITHGGLCVIGHDAA
jgi:hypothetical protein